MLFIVVVCQAKVARALVISVQSAVHNGLVHLAEVALGNGITPRTIDGNCDMLIYEWESQDADR